MIDHVSIGVRDVAKTKLFYDAALKPLGYTVPQRRRGIARLRARTQSYSGSAAQSIPFPLT